MSAILIFNAETLDYEFIQSRGDLSHAAAGKEIRRILFNINQDPAQHTHQKPSEYFEKRLR